MRVRLLLSAGRGRRECAWAVAELLRHLNAGDDAETFSAAWTGTLCWQVSVPHRLEPGRNDGSGPTNRAVRLEPLARARAACHRIT